MGNVCEADMRTPDTHIFNPIELDFKRVQNVTLPPSIFMTLNNIKQIASFPDPRENTGLKWYHAPKHDLYVLGEIHNTKPMGVCLFYLKNITDEDVPTVICTKIEENNVYSHNTLLLYSDKSYYLGMISSNGMESPIAEGTGTLVTSKFIYQGEFSKGLPHGYGTYKTRGGLLVGEFVKGQPHGKCVERTKKGLFTGELVARFRRTGRLIAPTNEDSFINEQYSTPGQGVIVEL